MSSGGYFNFALYIPPSRPSVIFVWTDARIEINGVVLSTVTNKATLRASVDEFDTTRVGDLYRRRAAALFDWSVTLAMWQDFALLDPAAFPIVGATVTAKLRPTTAAISASNPEYSGLALVRHYPVFDSACGEVVSAGLSLAGAAALVRSTS